MSTVPSCAPTRTQTPTANGLAAVDLDEADLDSEADLDNFDDLDADDADLTDDAELQAALADEDLDEADSQR